MKIVVLFVFGLIGAVFTATLPETSVPAPSQEVPPADTQTPSLTDIAANVNGIASETKGLPNVFNGLPSDPEALQKSIERMKARLPPSLQSMVDQQIAKMGGPENLQKSLNEQIEKYGGMEKMQEAVQAKVQNLKGMMGGFGGIMGGQNPLFASQLTGGIQVDPQPVAGAEPKKLNLTDKEGLKQAVDDIKKKLPPVVQEVVDKQLGDFDGSLPDLTHVGIDKFPTTEEEFKDAITKVKEQLSPEAKEMYEKVQQMRSSMQGSAQGGNPLASMLGGGNMQGMLQKLMAGGNPLASLMGNHGGQGIMQALMGGGNPLMSLLGQHSDNPMSMKAQLISSMMRNMQQKSRMEQQRRRDQQMLQMRRMQRMRRPVMRRPPMPRREVTRLHPMTVNININPGMVVDMHDISPAALHVLRTMYNVAPRYESRPYRPMPRQGMWRREEMRRPMYAERTRRPMSKGLEREILNHVFSMLHKF